MWMVANPRIYCLSTLTAFLGLTWFGAYLHAASEQEASKGDAVRRLSADEIASRAASATYYPQKDVRMDVSMSITDSRGRERTRQFTLLRRNEGDQAGPEASRGRGDQKFYLYFRSPPDVERMVFMVWKCESKTDDRWLYLPALDLVKRIAEKQRRTKLAGSHFFYEDISGRKVDDDRHTLIKTTENYYVLKNTPKDPDGVEFSYYELWIHRESYIPIRAIYYNKTGQEYRVYDVLRVETIQGCPTVTEARMRDLKSKGETVADYSRIRYNVNVPPEVFTERYLRSYPVKYLE